MKLFTVVSFLLLSSCGKLGFIEHNHSGEVPVVVSIDDAKIRKYFEAYCRDSLTEQLLAHSIDPATPDEQAVSDCVDDKVAQFLAAISSHS